MLFLSVHTNKPNKNQCLDKRYPREEQEADLLGKNEPFAVITVSTSVFLCKLKNNNNYKNLTFHRCC